MKVKKPSKLILFWLAGRMPSEAQLAAAETVAKENDAKVVFRNAKHFEPEHALETCDGVTGAATPQPYRDARTFIPAKAPAKGSSSEPKAPAAPAGGGNTTQAPADPQGGPQEGAGGNGGAEANALGLPKGHPETRDELKAALEAAKVEFKGNAATAALVELYTEKVINAEPDNQ